MSLQQEVRNIPDKISEQVALIRAGSKALGIIRDRTRKGNFLEEAKVGTSIGETNAQYSEKSAPVPYGLYRTKAGKKPPDDMAVFQNDSGTAMVILEGGYKQLRQIARKPSDHVVMSWSGRMMRNFGIKKKSREEVVLGFSDSYAERLARYHNIEGAGKNQVKHPFIGLTEEEAKEIVEVVEKMIDQVVRGL